jgi:CspA family cold shock protein
MSASYRQEGENGNLSEVPSGSKREEGMVKEFSYQRGYGFIQPRTSDEAVFVNIAAVRQSGIRRFEAGILVSYRLIEIDPGQFRAVDVRLVKVKPETEKVHVQPRNAQYMNKSPRGTPTSHTWISAVIKWFDSEKGYGFVKFPNGQKDAYLSKRVLGTLKITLKKPLENTAVKVQLMPGRIPDSIEVSAIAFL